MEKFDNPVLYRFDEVPDHLLVERTEHRGVVRDASAPVFFDEDTAAAFLAHPGSVVSYLSAALYWGLTLQNPVSTWLSVPRGKAYGGAKLVRFAPMPHEHGVVDVVLDCNVPVKMYDPAHTVVMMLESCPLVSKRGCIQTEEALEALSLFASKVAPRSGSTFCDLTEAMDNVGASAVTRAAILAVRAHSSN
ncbi:hypothetical protein ACFOY8_11830 [Thalassospira xianhensis]|uniref:Transcriptional regulator, AbiEi antitoxin, Type IV TA system n=2 Tax=Thalassospira TaxID=168934 RepID=A0A285U1S6_9PROT|nr:MULTISPECIES: hypothetical protein [Thalassospira]RCK04126.1 hypothetical protein TH5_21305 [Thalassospira xianhensis MCCC 1A02616]SOC30571.1 Transcriptional regulator, AbiEi antitoxin, Type IV TA system [Thalassospira xiamenensis]